MAQHIVLRSWTGIETGPANKPIQLPEGKVVDDEQYNLPQLQEWGLRLAERTPARDILLSVGDKDPGYVVAALLEEALGALTGYVIVEKKSDLPEPDEFDVIQLAPSCVYSVNGQVPLGTSRLRYALGTIVAGRYNSRDGFTYTGTGPVLQALGGIELRAERLSIAAPLGAAIDAVGGVVNMLRVVGQTERFGRAENCPAVVIQACNFTELESGIELVNASPGNVLILLETRMRQRDAGVGILVDLGTSVWESIQITQSELFSGVGGTDMSGLPDNGNLSPITGRGRVFDAIVNGLGISLAGIDVNDVQWLFTNSTGVSDSVNVGAIQASDNTDETAIGTQNVFVKVAGTTTGVLLQRFDEGDPVLDNNLRSTGLTPITGLVSVDAQLVKSGGAKVFALQVFRNGIAIGLPRNQSVGTQGAVLTFSQVANVNTGDVFDLRVANTEDTDNVTAERFTLSVIRI